MGSLHLAGQLHLFNHRLIIRLRHPRPKLAPNLIYNSTDLTPSSAGPTDDGVGRRLWNQHAACAFWQPWETPIDDLSANLAAPAPVASAGNLQEAPLGRS